MRGFIAAAILSLAASASHAEIVSFADDSAGFAAATGATSIGAFPSSGGSGTQVGAVTFTNPTNTGVANVIAFSNYSNELAGYDLAVSGVENVDLAIAGGAHAIGFHVHEPSYATSTGCNATCFDTTFRVELLSGTTSLGYVDYNAPDDASPLAGGPVGFIGVYSDVQFDHVRIRDRTNTIDNEFFGIFSIGTAPVPRVTLDLRPTVVAGCKSVTGTVSMPTASATDTAVTITDSLASATPPATVTIPAGATSKSFAVKTSEVPASEVGTVSATLGGMTVSQPLTVRPIGMQALTLKPSPAVGGKPVTGTAKLECKPTLGPVTVDLASTKPDIATPVAPSVVVSPGLQSATFDVTTTPVLAKTLVSLSGTANGIKKSKALTVNPAAAVAPTGLKFGNVVVGQTSGVLNATLTNKGIAPFDVGSIGITGTYAAWFAQTNNCPASLAPGASCTIGVTFTPAAALAKSAKLTIPTSATSMPLSVSLSGTGI
jgi:hypothetical protein